MDGKPKSAKGLIVVPALSLLTLRDHLTSKSLYVAYVHATVDGRNVKSGEETTIPISWSDDGVAEPLDLVEADLDAAEPEPNTREYRSRPLIPYLVMNRYFDASILSSDDGYTERCQP